MAQIKSIWGLANSKELKLSKEDLYSIVYRETKKDSLRELTEKEINRVVSILIRLKEKQENTRPGMATNTQIEKIKQLENKLGWDNPKRLEGFIKKYYKIEKLEWLEFKQAIKLIESLKKLLEKSEDKKREDAK